MPKITPMLAIVVCLLPTAFCRSAKAQDESYTARIVTGSTSAQQIQFTFTITKFTTEAELKELAGILKDQGQDALIEAMKKREAGRIYKLGDTGNEIAVAEKTQSGKDTIITMATARRMSVTELSRSAQHTDYPFGFLQVKLNEKGEGTGKMLTAAKIKFNEEKGHWELEPYGTGYTKVTNVAPNK
jgi:hypothetical protein